MDHEQFAAYLTVAGLADHTVRNYRAMWVRWHDYATAHGRDPLTPDALTVRAFAAQLTGTRSLIAHARATIGHACRALEVADTSGAIPLPRQPRSTSRALDREHAARLVEHAHRCGLAGLAVLVGLYTAARRGEIASLSWRHVDLEAGRVTLTRTKTRDLHTVPLHDALRAVLEVRRVAGEVWVFPGRHGGHVAPATVWRFVQDVAAGAGIGPVTPHQLRHTALTLANDATGDLRAVQTLAGHASPQVTAAYTRADDRAMTGAVAALDYVRTLG